MSANRGSVVGRVLPLAGVVALAGFALFILLFGWLFAGASSSALAAGPGPGGGGSVQISGEWAAPAELSSKTSDFGPRWVEDCGFCSTDHEGTDFAAGCGTPIYAASGGRVTTAGSYGGYGNAVIIDHGNGIETLYGHMPYGANLVREGQTVTTGQQIGIQGNTGNSFGCHLHFEVLINGVKIDPIPFLAERGIK